MKRASIVAIVVLVSTLFGLAQTSSLTKPNPVTDVKTQVNRVEPSKQPTLTATTHSISMLGCTDTTPGVYYFFYKGTGGIVDLSMDAPGF